MVKHPANLRLGTRGSALALWQARWVKARIETAHPEVTVHLQTLHTTGDRITDVPLAKIGDKGLFTKELDNAIVDGHVDLAVHSLKDVPTRLADGLALAAVSEREDPRDAFLPGSRRPSALADLPPGSVVGTSSLRRRAQLLHYRPDLRVQDLRGNLDTRLGRLTEGHYDAIVLALAGVRRLGREDHVGELLGPPQWLPAVSQGALGITTREGDEATAALVACLHDPDAAASTAAERAFLRALEGGCQIPIGALATIDGDELVLDGFVASIDGAAYIRDSARGPAADPKQVGCALADRLLDRGAGDVLRQVRDAAALPGGLPQASAP